MSDFDPCSALPPLSGNRWLIERRWRIQSLCLELQEYLAENPIPVKADWPFFSPLLAAAFSLWRAAFLADPGRKWQDIYEHAQTFLKFLIEDNAINYPQDRSTRAYSAGYYLNNAKFRLHEIWTKIPDHYEPSKRAKFETFWKTDLDNNSPPDAWDALFEALCLAFRFHQKYR
jgi:hypothetical protein